MARGLNAVVSADVLARFLKVTSRRVHQLVAEGVLPKTDKGRYELLPCVNAYVDYLRERAVPGDTVISDEHAKSKARLTSTRARFEEMKLAKLSGAYVLKSEVARMWAEIISAIRSHLLALPSKIAARVGMCKSTVEVQALLRREVEEVLNECSRILVEIEDDQNKGSGVSGDGSAGDAEAHGGATESINQ